MKPKQMPRIMVTIRKRPMSKKELSKGDKDVIVVKEDQISVYEEREKVDLTKYNEVHKYRFDRVYDEKTSTQDIYDGDVEPMIQLAYEGVKVTCFAYGQTGSGKTYTMIGNEDSPGLYSLAVEDVFAKKRSNHRIFVSFYEIYCSNLYDLINKRTKLVLREDAQNNINIIGLMETEVSSSAELMRCVEIGDGNRITSSTNANYDSSRSHAILQIRITENNKPLGKLSFIDLAGNERGADADVKDKQTRLDGAEINKSLLALKECIRALDQGGKHTPFRGSKLTLVLKDSFVGNCRTIMIGNVAPSQSCCELTLNTLRYADRVKDLTSVKSSETKKANAMMLARGNNKNSAVTNEKNPNYKNDEEEEVPFIKAATPSNKPVSEGPNVKKQLVRPKEGVAESKKMTRDELEDELMEEEEERSASRKRSTDGSSDKQSRQTTKRAEGPPKFEVISKFFKKAPEKMSQSELRAAHSKILDELAELRDSFIGECHEYLDMIKGNVRQEKQELDQFEDQTTEAPDYIQAVTMVVDGSMEMTIMVREHLLHLRKFMIEEKSFSRKFIQAVPHKPTRPPQGPSKRVPVKQQPQYEDEDDDGLLLDDD